MIYRNSNSQNEQGYFGIYSNLEVYSTRIPSSRDIFARRIMWIIGIEFSEFLYPHAVVSAILILLDSSVITAFCNIFDFRFCPVQLPVIELAY